MSIKQKLLQEIEQEFSNTKKMLERVPSDKFDWKPHEKSMTLKQLSNHIAHLAGMTGNIVSLPYLDLLENKGPKPEINSTEDLVNLHEQGTQSTLDALAKIQENELDVNWVFRAGERVIMEAPRIDVIRRIGLNHTYHHRAQLGMYLRLLNIPIPGMYGPSADDKN